MGTKLETRLKAMKLQQGLTPLEEDERTPILTLSRVRLLGHSFDIDLIPIELGSFDIIIDMDWLAKYYALIVCDKKVVCIPYGDEGLIIRRDDYDKESKAEHHIVYEDPKELVLLCTRMVLNEEDKVERFVGGLPNIIHGNLIAAEPTKLQDAIHIANNLMDQKLKGYARSAEKKEAMKLQQGLTPLEEDEQTPILTLSWVRLLGHSFDIDLIPVELGSFDVIIDMDWLAKYYALIVCDKKVVCIPYGDEGLIIRRDDCDKESKAEHHIMYKDPKEPIEDQPLPVDASPTALSPGYDVDSDLEKDKKDPKEDPANYPADRGDNDDDESSSDDDDVDNVEKDEEDTEDEEHLALADPSDVSTDDLVPSS
nr:reverse transcriptase domain-containing protein [Tanacetum cinerariifolium]